MQRRGASHQIKRARIETKQTKSYEVARQKCYEYLKQFSFVKVIEIVNVPAQNGKPSFYHGVAITIASGKQQQEVFFDKGSRLRYTSLIEIGPCKLVDAAISRDHVNSIPHVGDILIGVLADNLRKSKIQKVLRSWSRHGNLVLELNRLIEHGTHQSDAQIRKLLTQTESILAETLRYKPTHFPATDDFWILAKIILWRDTRTLAILHSIQNTDRILKIKATENELDLVKSLKINCSANDFISGIAFRFEDPSIMNDFADHFEPVVFKIPETTTTAYLSSYIAGGTSPPYQPYDPEETTKNIQQQQPTSPLYGIEPKSTTPLYASSTPLYASTSPLNVQSTSPKEVDVTPAEEEEKKIDVVLQPTSPMYQATSPLYEPT